MIKLTDKQIEIMSHSLGISFKEILTRRAKTKRIFPKDFYRNRFITSVGYRHSDQDTLEELEQISLMRKFDCSDKVNVCWIVEEEGINLLKEHFNNLKNES